MKTRNLPAGTYRAGQLKLSENFPDGMSDEIAEGLSTRAFAATIGIELKSARGWFRRAMNVKQSRTVL
jgi:hypothetical protein